MVIDGVSMDNPWNAWGIEEEHAERREGSLECKSEELYHLKEEKKESSNQKDRRKSRGLPILEAKCRE